MQIKLKSMHICDDTEEVLRLDYSVDGDNMALSADSYTINGVGPHQTKGPIMGLPQTIDNLTTKEAKAYHTLVFHCMANNGISRPAELSAVEINQQVELHFLDQEDLHPQGNYLMSVGLISNMGNIPKLPFNLDVGALDALWDDLTARVNEYSMRSKGTDKLI